VRTTKQLLETFARELPKGEDDDAVRAASYLVKDHGREDLVAPMIEAAKIGKRDELRGLAVAALWDAGKREQARDLAKDLLRQNAGLFSSAWAGLVLLADAGRIAANQPLAHEPLVRWMQAGWLE
jgi:hypothetical protein